MRVVQVAPYPLFPTWAGGKIRVVELGRALAARGVDLTVVTPFHHRQRRAYFRDEAFRLVEVPYPFVLPFLFTDRPYPYQHLMSYHPGLAAMVRPLLRGFDVCLFEQAPFAGLLDSVPAGTATVYSSQNVEADYVRAECAGKGVAAAVERRIRACEERLVRECARVFTVSEADKERMGELYGVEGERVSVYPNGIGDLREAGTDVSRMVARFPGLGRFARRAIYSGSDVEHNRIAVRFVLEQLAPARPEMGFIFQGTCGARFVDSGLPNVFFDLDPHRFDDYAVEGTIGLNPVRTGGGTNLKVLHYLSRGLPVVTTRFGLRGHEAFADAVTVAELDEMAAALDRPVTRRPDRARLEALRWSEIGRRMADELREVAAARG